MAIELQAVTSSLIAAIGFDRETQELIIQFPKGGTYAYKGTDERAQLANTHHANLTTLMLQGESVGKYFLKHVKNAPDLTYRKVGPAVSPSGLVDE